MLADFRARLFTLIRDQGDRPVFTDRQNIIVGLERGKNATCLNIRTETTDIGLHFLASIGINPDNTRQSQKLFGLGQVNDGWLQSLGQGCAFRFDLFRLAVLAFDFLFLAKLDVDAIRAFSKGDLLACFLINAKDFWAGIKFGLGAVFIGNERPGIIAFRIVRAAQEGAKLAELEAQCPIRAFRAFMRVCSVFARRKQIVFQHHLKGIKDVSDLEFLGLVDIAFERLPEILENVFPFQLAHGNFIKLVFQIGGEVVLHIAFKEFRQEGGYQTTTVLCDETATFQQHIVPVLKNRNDRRIGRRTANAEFFHLLDQARLGIAGRRLGEVLINADFAKIRLLAFF